MGKRKPVVFYQRFGKICIRSNCDKMNQTEPMKASAKIFGKASNIASVMRSLLRPVIPNPKDSEMQRQFQNCLQHWLLISPLSDPSPQNDIPFVTGFQFNNESDLRGRCKIDLQVNRDINEDDKFIHSFICSR